jgi:hypothetical protein
MNQEINDGFSLDGYVRARPGVYPAMRFKYRPIPSSHRLRIYDNWKNLPDAEQAQRVADAMARQISWWELKDPSGKALNCRDAATYRNLWSFHLYNRLQEIVFEAGDSDRDPNVEPQPAPSGFAESGEGNSSAG